VEIDTGVFTLHRGTQPLLVSVPHVARELPVDQHHRYVERAFAFEKMPTGTSINSMASSRRSEHL
jgi:hypothetical protein